ncbi:MAG: DNA/RNA nuclease SfsA [Woronichinia naegeliana WA131]|jgi:sugar fermentation stimulation protein A|uniref:Sugar fermentation stimulation protein homolog n=1 Tax=Woronichinia naegeliana WA131 TaxID=2824559 RepID=A0A977PYI7_9CYAN|nr:MAG: DNA/RNA nuclease SfsA [Woronichinia naegeliana WA131]
MTNQFFYPYPPLILGKLQKRYKRFFADIELETGEMITAHCPNTGPMTGVCQIGNLVYVSPSNNPKRKLAYTWEMIQIQDTWVGVNTNLPNQVIKQALTQKIFPELADLYDTVKSEVPYGQDRKSRIDFLLSQSGQPDIYLEVKNTTLAQKQLALFPDTVTTRGQKHLEELTALLPSTRSVMLYFINRGDCSEFSPGDEFDPHYGQLLRLGISQGLMVLPCRFEVTPQGLRYLGLAQLSIEN